MNSQFVLTIMGEDRPGLTSALSAAVFRSGGNWLEGHLSRLGGLFTGAVLIELPADRLPDLKAAMAAPDLAALKVDITPAGDQGQPGERLHLSLTSADRPGIVNELSLILARLGVNIVELETSAAEGAWQGSPIFRASLQLALPAGLSHATLQEALEQLSGDLMVEVEPA